jgi:hypothetical protein
VKGSDIIANSLILSDEELDSIGVGFSQKQIKLHKGIAGLKYYLIVMYLRFHLESINIVRISLNELVQEVGYSISSRRKSMYDDWRDILNDLIVQGYIMSSEDILTVNPTVQFTITFYPDKNLFFTNDPFVFITKYEFDKIAGSNFTGNKSVLLGVFLYIKKFIFNKDTGISHPTKYQIKNELGISTSTVESAISALEDISLIYIKSGFYIEDTAEPGTYVPASNVYSLSGNIPTDIYIKELEHKYGRPVYTVDTVPGRIKYLSKSKFN